MDSMDSFDIFTLSVSIEPLLLINPLNGTQCFHRADECKFLLVGLHSSLYVKELIRERYEFVPTSLAVHSMSSSSNLDGL